jgi:hypothetical protein
MSLGRHLRELWQFRLGLMAAAALALFAAVWSVGQVSLLPPSIKSRNLEMAAASTRVLVDTPKSAILDLSVNTYDFRAYTNRSLLVANIMASPPLRGYIARRAHVPADALQVASPVTPDFPRPLASDGEKHSSDILKSPDAYRLSVQSNPTVPVADVYAEAPTAEAAQQLANGAVDGMKDYLRDLAASQQIPDENQVHLVQLGRAKGGVIDPGISAKVALLTFLLVFAVASAAVLFLNRVRQGWILEKQKSEALAAQTPETG